MTAHSLLFAGHALIRVQRRDAVLQSLEHIERVREDIMRTIHRTLLLTLALGAVSTLPVAAQPTASTKQVSRHRAKHQTAAQLRAEAKITEVAARATALAEVPGGRVQKGELERESGKLVYSYDVKTDGKSGVDEIWVDAITGKVIKKEHETPAKERAEAKKEAKEAKKP
jgi:uncharacterized membrane protein YkoI